MGLGPLETAEGEDESEAAGHDLNETDRLSVEPEHVGTLAAGAVSRQVLGAKGRNSGGRVGARDESGMSRPVTKHCRTWNRGKVPRAESGKL